MTTCYHENLIKRNTNEALDSCKDAIESGTLTGFTECVLFLSGYCKHYPVRFDLIVDQLREWAHEGLIKGPWEV